MSILKDIVMSAYGTFNQDRLLEVNHVMERHSFIIKSLNHSGFSSLDTLEIGAHQGLTTIILLREAFEYGTKVHVIDPFDGRECGTEKVFKEFCDRTFPYKNFLCHQRVSSTDQWAKEYIKDLKLSFSYVDGLHNYPHALSDIQQCMSIKTKIISVDDVRGYRFSEPIMRAVRDCERDFCYDYTLVHSPDNIQETYFILNEH